MASFITGKQARTVVSILIFILFLSNLVRVWIVINGSKFMYIVLNSIIISILIFSSSFIPYITNIFLELHKKSKLQIQFSNQKIISSPPYECYDDNTWSFFTYLMETTPTSTDYQEEKSSDPWFGVHEEDTRISTTEKEKTLSIVGVHKQEQEQEQAMESSTTLTTEEDKSIWWLRVLEEEEYLHLKDETEDEKTERLKEGKEAEVEQEENGLDATWKAIMESKDNGIKPQPRKSDDNDDGEESRKEKGGIGGLSKYRVQEQLKKWNSFRDMVERRGNTDTDTDTDTDMIGRGGGKRPGWRSMEVVLTFQDDFKKRADEFIARFTHDIRLQRLESDQRFFAMINRGL